MSTQALRMGEKAKAWRDAAATATAIERLERARQGVDDGGMALDKEQQARFDDLTRRFPPGHRGWSGGPGRGA